VPDSARTAAAIVIAGAGECGTRAAFALREQGWDGRVILAGAGVTLKSVLRSPVAG